MSKNIFFYIISIISTFFLLENISVGNEKIYELDDFSKEVVNAITKNNYKKVATYLSEKVWVHNVVNLGNFHKASAYGGLLSQKGKLYAVVFDTKKAQIVIGDNEIYSFSEVLSKSNLVKSFLENEIPIIQSVYKGYHYTIFLKKFSDKEYRIEGFEISKMY